MPDYRGQYECCRLQLLREMIPYGSGAAIDLGCNDGTTTRMLAERGYRPVGIDIDPAAIERARERFPGLEFRVGSVEAARQFAACNLVLLVEVLEHIAPSAQQDFVNDVVGLLRPGGRLILSTPGRYSLYSIYERARWCLRGRRGYSWWDDTHVGVVSARRLRTLLRRAGVHIDGLTGYHYLPERLRPPMVGRRWPLNLAGFDLIVSASR